MRFLDHVVAMPSGDRDKRDRFGVVADLLNIATHFFFNFLKPRFTVRRLSGVHFVNTHSESQKSMLTSLTVFRDTGFELAVTSSNDENGAIRLWGTSDHVFDKIAMAGSVNDGDVILSSFEFPQCNINSDTSFSFSFQLVQHPRIFEGSFSHLLGFFLKFLDSTFVDATAFVDHMTSGCGFTGVDMANDDDVNMDLLLSHFPKTLLSQQSR